MSKGSRPRPVDKKRYDSEFDRIFNKPRASESDDAEFTPFWSAYSAEFRAFWSAHKGLFGILAVLCFLAWLLSACSSSPRLTELEDQYFQCTRAQATGCDLLADEIDRRYAARDRRELRKRDAVRRRCSSGNAKCFVPKEPK